jgi:hypothetical protein
LAAGFGSLALFGVAVLLTDKSLKRFFPEPRDPLAPVREPGCLLQAAVCIAWLLVLGLLFWPSIEALKRHACKGSTDFEYCMEGGPNPEYDRL